jgi:Anti-sigma factor NepR
VPNSYMADDNLDEPDLPRSNAKTPKTDPQVSPRIQEAIGDGLRAMYDSLKAEPLPDHLLQLLKKLDEPQRGEDQ